MRKSIFWGALAALLCLSLALAAPSGAITAEADARYQDALWDDWDEGASAKPYRVLANAALSDILPAADVSGIPGYMDATGRAPIEANYTDTSYRDDTIIVELEEVQRDDSTYHVAYVRVASPSQVRTMVAGGVDSKRTAPTSRLAASVNAVVAVNGDFYSDVSGGYIVRQGETVRKKVSDNYDLLLIDENADFHLLKAGKSSQKAAIKEFLTQHELINAFFFGPALVIDGVKQDVPKSYGWNPTGREPRAAIGQITALTYAIVTVDGRIDSSAGVTLNTLADFMESIGCQQAYNLDGGNSSALVFHNRLISVKSVEERSVHDIIYFASATMEGE